MVIRKREIIKNVKTISERDVDLGRGSPDGFNVNEFWEGMRAMYGEDTLFEDVEDKEIVSEYNNFFDSSLKNKSPFK